MRNTFLCAAVVILSCGFALVEAQETVLYSFSNIPDGAGPEAALVLDAAGNLYGTTAGGGAYGYGTVFELSKGPNGVWNETVLYSFTGGADGAEPVSTLVFDKAGNLYGTTPEGGNLQGIYGSGVVFELTPTQGGGWTESVIYTFHAGSDGTEPTGGVVFDGAGNLYGTTVFGGTAKCVCGTVFELTPIQGGGWTKTTLYSFTGLTDGNNPRSPLIIDASGNLYGTTYSGGKNGTGTVFRLSPTANGWNGEILHAFNNRTELYPSGSLTLDSSGNLYGATGGGGAWDGTVFMLSPTPIGPWKETVKLFNGDDGGPNGGLVFDGAGNLYGTTWLGGGTDERWGSVFRLSPGDDGGVTLQSFFFNLTDGYSPRGGVILDSSGNVYGTTIQGGSSERCGNGCGEVFEITP